MNPVSLVTGANRGVGLEVARQLAEVGHAVYLGSRSTQALLAPLRDSRHPRIVHVSSSGAAVLLSRHRLTAFGDEAIDL